MKILLCFLLMLCLSFQNSFAKDCKNNKNRSNYNVLHYDVNISIDTLNGKIDGQVKIKAECLNNPKTPFQVDLQAPMDISSIWYEKQKLVYKKINDRYLVSIPKLLSGETFEITVHYSGIPQKAKNAPWDGGLLQTKDANNTAWLAMACQNVGASVWMPCKDFDADEPEQGVDLHYTVPNGLIAVGNGRMLNVRPAPNNHNTWNWKVVSPINLYNITFYVGDYLRFQEQTSSINGTLDLDYFVLKNNFQKAKEQFKMVPEMISIFEDWMGPYPFFNDGFKLVEAPFLGMEHQSAIAYGNNYLMGYNGKSRSGTAIDTQFDFIIVHEAGHEWFGNSISISDAAYFWIHEGFTSYTEVMYIESKFGKATAVDYLVGTRKLIQNKAPLQGKTGLCFNENADNYPKGANLIHNIRMMMRDDVKFKQLIRDINEHFHKSVVDGPTMEAFIIQKTGLNLSAVFEQYLRNTTLPTLQIHKNENGFSYKWTNCIASFDMPIIILIDGKEIILNPTNQEQNYVKDNYGTIALHPEFYCGLTLK